MNTRRGQRIASGKIFPGDVSIQEETPLSSFSTSAATHLGTKNAQQIVPPRQKPTLARLGKQRKILEKNAAIVDAAE